MQKIIVDTNVLLDGLDVNEFERVIVPIIVIEELDELKRSKNKELAIKAKNAIKMLDKANNIEIKWNSAYSLPLELANSNDNKIIAYAKDCCEFDNECIFLSNDYNVRLKARYLGISCSEYTVKDENEEIYTGIKYIEIQDSDTCIEDAVNRIDLSECVENQYILIGNWEWNEEFQQNQFKAEKSFRYTKGILDNVRSPRLGEKLNDNFRDNAESKCLYDAINNDNIDIIIVFGDAGTSKGYSSLAYCLNNVNTITKNKKGQYKPKSILYTRSTVEVGQKQGYLPGSPHEKAEIYFQPARDNLNKILDIIGLKETYEALIDSKKYIEMPLSYMRGCTIDNSYMILDEASNSSVDEVKMFISRAGIDSKVIIMGSLNQIDNKNLNDYDNGLYQIIKAYKGQYNCAIIRMNNQKRSFLSRQADLLL